MNCMKYPEDFREMIKNIIQIYYSKSHVTVYVSLRVIIESKF